MEEKLQHDEINLLGIISVILRRKKFIIGFSFALALITVVYCLVTPEIFEGKAIIVPTEQQQEGNRGSALSGVASQFGLSLGASSKTEEIIAQLKSNFVRETVIRKYSLMPIFLRYSVFKRLPFIPAWILARTDVTGISENRQMWMALGFLDGALTINNKEKDGVVEIIAEFNDPVVATDIVKHLLVETNERVSNDAKRVAVKNRKYLESIVDKTADPLIKLNVYNQIAQQIQTEMAAEAKEDFAFKVIDPPRVPVKKARPKTVLMTIVGFIAGLFLGTFLAFVKEFIDNNEEARCIVETEKKGLKRAFWFFHWKRKSGHKLENPTKHQEEC